MGWDGVWRGLAMDWGGTAGLGQTGLRGAHLDGVTVGAAVLGAWGQQLDGWPWGDSGNSWNGVAGGTSGCQTRGIPGRAATGAVQGWKQLDLALGHIWTGEAGEGDGHGWVTLMGTKGCPSRHGAKPGPRGARGAQLPPSHPRSSHGGSFSLRMNSMKSPVASRSREMAAGWQEQGH